MTDTATRHVRRLQSALVLRRGANSLNFLRLVLASLVIVSHSIVIGGFGNQQFLRKSVTRLSGRRRILRHIGLSHLRLGSASHWTAWSIVWSGPVSLGSDTQDLPRILGLPHFDSGSLRANRVDVGPPLLERIRESRGWSGLLHRREFPAGDALVSDLGNASPCSRFRGLGRLPVDIAVGVPLLFGNRPSRRSWFTAATTHCFALGRARGSVNS